MAVAYTQETFETGKQLLAFPEPYVCVAHTFLKGEARATDVNGKKIIKAGTVYPANGATAVGIVFNDYDVTDGDVSGAILLEGYVKKSALPEVPSAEAITAMKKITLMPVLED